jgi:hypothetical protein
MKRSPVVAVQGGLGNQLFQWFYAHSISQGSRFSLYPKIPTGPVAQVVYELGLGPLISTCAHCTELQMNSRKPLRNLLLPRIFDYLWSIPALTRILRIFGYFRENPRSKTRAHQVPPKRVRYANGYFQNWKYAESQRNIIISELIPILDKTFEAIKSRFDLDQAYTVIHVRRGDYRTDQNPETMIGSLSDEYFIDWNKQYPSDRLVLLVENRTDVEKLIGVIHPFLILDNTLTNAWETLAIMSSSQTILGSNSTLSWWGAWIAREKGAMTFLPSDWDVMGRFNPADFLFPGCHARTPIWEKF